MKRLFAAIFIPFFALNLAFAQQEIKVEEKNRNEYTVKMSQYIVVQDFEFISAVTTDQRDMYIINVRALNADKILDTNVKGKLLFEINGQMMPVDFTDGLGSVTAEIKGTDKITMRAIDSDITRTGTISHPFPWSKIGGLVVALAALGALVWFIQQKKKK